MRTTFLKLTTSFFFLLFSFAGYSQSTSIDDANKRFADEQRINDQVTSQSADPRNKSKAKYYQQTSATGGGSSAGKPNLDNLTDADRQTVDNYVHHEYVQNAMDEECQKDKTTNKACQGQDVGNGMVQALAQAYGMIVGIGGLGGGLKMCGGDSASKGADSAAKGADGAKKGTDGAKDAASGEKKTRHDYCKYVAIVTEAVSMFQQQQAQQNLMDGDQAKADTSQKAALYKAARSHQERAKTAKLQFAGWGITAGCYVAMLATGAALDWSLGIKLAGSSLLTYFFKEEIDKHQDAYEKTRAIADKLPGRGDCNPVSENDCYCSMPTTQNDVRYCQKHLHDRTIAGDSIRTTCTTNTLQQDPKCTCVRTNTCFDQEFLNMAEIQGLPPSFTANVAKPFSQMTRGELTSGALSAANNANAAAARNMLRKVNKKLADKTFNPTKAQKDAIKAMAGSGIPTNVAAALSTSPVDSAALAKAKSALGGAGGPINIVRSKGRGNSNVWGFGGKQQRKKRRKRKTTNKFAKLGKKRSPTGKVIDFAEKASAKAQINQDRDRPIFEIISRRYQLSAPDRLGVE